MIFQSPYAHADTIPIRLHPNNNHYFEFRGEPTVLITSTEFYGSAINLEFDYDQYLIELEEKGLNYTRIFTGSYVKPTGDNNMPNPNNLAPEPGQLIVPWARSNTGGYIGGGNKFDLNTWNSAYFERLKDFVYKAGQKGIVVEVTLFSDYPDNLRWGYSPLKSTNNVNGVGTVARLDVLTPDNGNLQPVMDDMVVKICQELKDYDNVIYEIANEPYWPNADSPASSDPELSQVGCHMDWQRHIATLLDSIESTFTHKHLIAQNMDNYWTDITVNQNKLTDATNETSVFNFHYNARNDTYLDNSIELNYDLNKPIGCDETGWLYGGNEDKVYRHQAWKLILAGGAIYNNLDLTFDINHPSGNQTNPDNKWGGGETLRTQLGYLSSFIHSLDLVNMGPHNDLPKSGGIIAQVSPSTVKVRCLADIGNEYAIYVYGGSQADITFNLPTGDYAASWIDTKTGDLVSSLNFAHSGGTITLESPAYTEEDIALKIISGDEQQQEPDLIAHWALDDGSGNTAADGSDNNNDGTLNNGPVWSDGIIGGTLSFDGNNDYVEIEHIDNYLVDDGSVALWFRVEDANIAQGLLSKDASGFGTGGHLDISLNSSGKVQTRFQSTSQSYILESGTVTANEWHHMVFTFGETGMKLHLDGELVDDNLNYTGGMGSSSGGNGNTEPIALGARTIMSGNNTVTPIVDFLNGELDDIRIYNYALGLSQINELIQLQPVNTAPVVDAGTNQTITLPASSVELNGSVTDDGLPTGGNLTTEWSKISGPGTVTFDDPAAVNTSADFSTAGVYVLKLEADDGELSASDNVSITVEDYPDEPDLIAHWALDDGSGNTAADGSDNNNDGTLNNGPVWSDGIIGGTLSFDGNNDYVEIEHIDNYLVDDGSVALWFRVEDANIAQGLLSKDASGFGTGGHLDISLNSSGKVQTRFQSTSQSYILESGTVTANEWHHMVFTFGETGMKLHLDGELVDDNLNYTGGMGSSSGGNGNTEPIALGARTIMSGNNTVTPIVDFLNGELDDIRIYNYALGLSQINELIQLQPVNTAPVVDAGTNQTITLPASSVELNGSVTDDGLPTGGNLTTEWSKISGPGTVTFDDPAAVNTSADFSTAGVYVLKLEADDGELSASDNVSITVEDYPDEPDLIAHWALDDGSGNTAADGSDNNNDGTLNNGPVWSDGIIGGTLSFDGNNDYVEIEHIDNYLVDDGSVALWFRVEDANIAQGLLSKDASGFGTGGHLDISLNSSGKVQTRFQSTSQSYILESGTVTANEWHHMVFTFGETGMKLHLDGELVDDNLNYTGGMGSSSGGNGNTEPIALGARTIMSGNNTVTPIVDFLNGELDDIRIYNYALGLSQINELIQLQPVNTAPVVDAGTNQTITLPASSVELNGSVTDDGLPTGGNLTTEWSKISGPGTVTFDDPAAVNTSADFSTAGVYVLKLEADDGELSASDNVSITVEDYPDEPDLIAHWALDDGSGNTAADGSDNNNDGTLNNGPVWSDGIIGGTLSFDGNNDYVEIEHIDNYLVDDGSVALWFRVEDANIAQGLLSKDASGFGTGGHLDISLNSSGKVQTRFQSTSQSYILESGTVTANEWHHMVFTFGETGMKLHLDGELVDDNLNYTGGMGSSSGGNGNTEPIALGARTIMSGNNTVTPIVDFLNGELDDIRIYNYALGLSQINELIQLQPVNTAPVVDAGTNQTITLPASSVELNGSVTDDGLPTGGNLTTEWSKISGPGTVTFDDPAAVNTSADFSTAGVYVLKLEADDGELSASDNVSITVEDYPDEPDLIAHWALDDGSGNTAADGSDNNNDGTLNNGPVWSDGIIGGALSFDGNNDYVEIEHIDNYLLAETTIAFWFSVDNTIYVQGLFSKDSYGYDTGGHVDIFLDEFGKINSRFQSIDETYNLVSDAINANEWHHVTFTVNSTTISLFIDGLLVDYNNNLSLTANDVGNFEPIALGARTDESGNYTVTPLHDFLNGKLDDVRVYSRNLNQSEIEELANIPITNSQQANNDLVTGNFFSNEIHPEFVIKNYPNPFSESTTIQFEVAETNPTTLKIYNAVGEELITLFDRLAKGGVEYNLKFYSYKYPKGVYYYSLKSGDKILVTKKMVLIK